MHQNYFKKLNDQLFLHERAFMKGNVSYLSPFNLLFIINTYISNKDK